jgi:uncharacterized membrane protein YbhN (UPF0104 family)
MRTFVHAVGDFAHSLAGIGWTALAIALAFHFLRISLRPFAWRNIILAAYPGEELRRRTVWGAYVAGVGVNAIVPARAGDALKLYLVHRERREFSYATLGATLLPETLFDSVVAGLLLLWAFGSGTLPGIDVLPDLPNLDWGWVKRHRDASLVIGGITILTITFLLTLAERRIKGFWRRVGQGFAILRDWRAYVTGVIPWQTGSWICRIASAYFFLHAFHIPASLRNALAVVAAQSISTLLPFTPGGIGTVQALILYVFRDLPRTTVLAFAVGMHFATVIFNLVVGFTVIFVTLGTLRWRRVVKPEERLAEQ